MKTLSYNVVWAYLFTGIYLLWKVKVKFCYDKLYRVFFFLISPRSRRCDRTTSVKRQI
jgi:hypothetical protein